MAIPLALIPAGLQLVTGAAQAIGGAIGKSKLDRPEYQIPSEIQENVNLAQVQATEGLGAAQEQYMRQQADRGTAAALASGSERGAGFAGMGGILDAQNQAFMSIAMQDQAIRQQARQELMRQKGILSEYKDKAFAVNKMQPYQEKLESAQANIGAGMQNIMGAATSAATAFGDKEFNIENRSSTGDEDADLSSPQAQSFMNFITSWVKSQNNPTGQ